MPYRHDFGEEGKREDRIKHFGMSIFSNWIQLNAFCKLTVPFSILYVYITVRKL